MAGIQYMYKIYMYKIYLYKIYRNCDREICWIGPLCMVLATSRTENSLLKERMYYFCQKDISCR